MISIICIHAYHLEFFGFSTSLAKKYANQKFAFAHWSGSDSAKWELYTQLFWDPVTHYEYWWPWVAASEDAFPVYVDGKNCLIAVGLVWLEIDYKGVSNELSFPLILSVELQDFTREELHFL